MNKFTKPTLAITALLALTTMAQAMPTHAASFSLSPFTRDVNANTGTHWVTTYPVGYVDPDRGPAQGRGAARIVSAEMARAYANGEAVGVTQRFHPTDTVHCVIYLSAAPAGTVVRVVWVALNAGGLHNYKLLARTGILQGVQNVADATLTHSRPLPVGTYQVVIYLNGRLDRTLTFAIQ